IFGGKLRGPLGTFAVGEIGFLAAGADGGLGVGRKKSPTPNTKHQKTSNAQPQKNFVRMLLEFDVWKFFDVWCLVFGVSLLHATAEKIFKKLAINFGISASGIIFGPSLNARSGSGCVSMNRPFAPAASAQ